MPFAPLRRITARQLNVFEHRRGFPTQFAVIDTLECGHTVTLLGWMFLDLADPNTDNPEVSARRHRCRACARILKERKTHVEDVSYTQDHAVSG